VGRGHVLLSTDLDTHRLQKTQGTQGGSCRSLESISPKEGPAAVQNPYHIAYYEGFYMRPLNLLESNRLYRDSHDPIDLSWGVNACHY
jgi:hypothetical protein